MDHESTLANAGSPKLNATTKAAVAFDNQGTAGLTVFKASLSGGTDDNAPTLGEMALSIR